MDEDKIIKEIETWGKVVCGSIGIATIIIVILTLILDAQYRDILFRLH